MQEELPPLVVERVLQAATMRHGNAMAMANLIVKFLA
jgi:hypothetical protein